MIIATSERVFLEWGNIGKAPLQNGNYPLFHHYNVWRRSAQGGEVFVGETAAMAFLDEHVTPGVNHVYRVDGVRINLTTRAIVSITTVLGPTAVAVPSVTDDQDKQTTCKPVNYVIGGALNKLKHRWSPGPDTMSGLLGVFVEDRADGHAKAFIPAAGTTGKWDEKIITSTPRYTRLRSVDKALNVSEPTPWVKGSVSNLDRPIYGTADIWYNLRTVPTAIYGLEQERPTSLSVSFKLERLSKYLADPTVAPVASFNNVFVNGYLAAGVYRFKVSFVNVDGETLPGPASAPITVPAQGQLKVQNIQVGPTGTTSRYLYVSIDGGPYRKFFNSMSTSGTDPLGYSGYYFNGESYEPMTVNTTGVPPYNTYNLVHAAATTSVSFGTTYINLSQALGWAKLPIGTYRLTHTYPYYKIQPHEAYFYEGMGGVSVSTVAISQNWYGTITKINTGSPALVEANSGNLTFYAGKRCSFSNVNDLEPDSINGKYVFDVDKTYTMTLVPRSPYPMNFTIPETVTTAGTGGNFAVANDAYVSGSYAYSLKYGIEVTGCGEAGWAIKMGDKIRTAEQLTELQNQWDYNFGGSFSEDENGVVFTPGPKEPLTGIAFSFMWSHSTVYEATPPNPYDGWYGNAWDTYNGGRPYTGAAPWYSTAIIKAHRPTHVGQWKHEYDGYYTYEEMTATYADFADVHFGRVVGGSCRRYATYRYGRVWDPDEEWWYEHEGRMYLAFRGCWVADYSQPWQEWVAYSSNEAWYSPMPLTNWGAILHTSGSRMHTGLEYLHGEYPSWYSWTGNMWIPDVNQWILP